MSRLALLFPGSLKHQETVRHELEASSLPYGRGGATGICLLISHTGIDLESIEAVVLFVIVRQDANSALHKSPTRFFRVGRVLIYLSA